MAYRLKKFRYMVRFRVFCLSLLAFDSELKKVISLKSFRPRPPCRLRCLMISYLSTTNYDRTNAQDKDCHILLQNENGPCPLLAAANALLLKKEIELPSNCIGASVIKIDELINVLAEKVLHNSSDASTPSHQHEQRQFAVQELLDLFPSLQFGMDVNPKFTKGPNGVEYTKQLNAFDLLHVELVHGWLIDPVHQKLELSLVGQQTYNQLVTQVIKGNEAQEELERIIMLPPAEQAAHAAQLDALSALATHGQSIHEFLQQSSHQLTQYGLETLYSHLKEKDLVVFFRNNHFNTLTKHEGFLYLLVTDLGYATVDVVWEKLDVIDGDTEYVSATFQPPPALKDMMAHGAATGEQLVANDLQSQSDYQLALQLSRETTSATNQNVGGTVAVPPIAGTSNSASSGITGAIAAAASNFMEGTSSMLRGGPSNTTSIDRDLQAAQQASLEAYNQQQSYNPQYLSQGSSIGQRPSSSYQPTAAVPQSVRGSIARVPVGRPSPLAGNPTVAMGQPVAVGVTATLAPGEFPLHPQQVQYYQNNNNTEPIQTATVTVVNRGTAPSPTVVDSLSGHMGNMNIGANNTNPNNCNYNPGLINGHSSGVTMPTNNSHWEDQDRLMAMRMQQEQHDDHEEASRQLALKLEREEQQRLAQQRSRNQTAPPPRAQPTAPPRGSASDSGCIIS